MPPEPTSPTVTHATSPVPWTPVTVSPLQQRIPTRPSEQCLRPVPAREARTAPVHRSTVQEAPACLLVSFLPLLRPHSTPRWPPAHPPHSLDTCHSSAWDAFSSGYLTTCAFTSPRSWLTCPPFRSLCCTALNSPSREPRRVKRSWVTCRHPLLQPPSSPADSPGCGIGLQGKEQQPGWTQPWTECHLDLEQCEFTLTAELSARPVQMWPVRTQLSLQLTVSTVGILSPLTLSPWKEGLCPYCHGNLLTCCEHLGPTPAPPHRFPCPPARGGSCLPTGGCNPDPGLCSSFCPGSAANRGSFPLWKPGMCALPRLFNDRGN